MNKPIRIAFVKDHLEYKSADSEVRTMKMWVELHADNRPCKWTITENPADVLTDHAKFDIVLIDYGGAWWHRSYESAGRLDAMFSPFAQWAAAHPGVLVVLATAFTSHFFEELSENWQHWPDNIVKCDDGLADEGERIEAWVKSIK